MHAMARHPCSVARQQQTQRQLHMVLNAAASMQQASWHPPDVVVGLSANPPGLGGGPKLSGQCSAEFPLP